MFFQVYLMKMEKHEKKNAPPEKLFQPICVLVHTTKKSLYKALDENISGCQPYFQPTLHTDVLSN